MPYLGRRDSDYVDMGISADGGQPLPTTTPLEDRVALLVTRVAHDDLDRQNLLEALGLAPTVDTLPAAG
ncbi:hypothetical protein ACXR2U_13750 [Jatrophihabitans sp. YIM 134969]